MKKIDLEEYIVEGWKLDDERLPVNEKIVRVPPTTDFVASMRTYKQLYPILMCHNEQDGWFLGFGSKRLLALRILNKEDPIKFEKVWVRIAEGVTREEGRIFSMIENAQRSENAINAFEVIQYILKTDKNATYKSIAEKIHMPVTYVKTIALKYGKIPDWTLRAALDGKIVEATAIKIGSFAKGTQVECKKEFEASGKLSLKVAQDKKRVIQKNIVAKMSPAMGFMAPTNKRQPFYPVKVLDELKVLLEAKKYKQAVVMLEDLGI